MEKEESGETVSEIVTVNSEVVWTQHQPCRHEIIGYCAYCVDSEGNH